MTHSRQDVAVLAQGSEGGGAEISQVIGLSAVTMAVTAVLLWIGYLHRQRKISWLENLAEWLGRRFKRPPWVALPIAIFVSAIICALFVHLGRQPAHR